LQEVGDGSQQKLEKIKFFAAEVLPGYVQWSFPGFFVILMTPILINQSIMKQEELSDSSEE
jgi:hypothetical protein